MHACWWRIAKSCCRQCRKALAFLRFGRVRAPSQASRTTAHRRQADRGTPRGIGKRPRSTTAHRSRRYRHVIQPTTVREPGRPHRARLRPAFRRENAPHDILVDRNRRPTRSAARFVDTPMSDSAVSSRRRRRPRRGSPGFFRKIVIRNKARSRRAVRIRVVAAGAEL